MSELSIEPKMPEEKLKELPVERKPENGRPEWVEMVWGIIVLYMIATISFPGDGLDLSSIPVINGIFEYAALNAGRITLRDVGLPLFVFLMGLTLPISYRKRKEEKGAKSATKYILFQYFLLFVLGFVIANINLDFLKYYSVPSDSIIVYTGGGIPLSDRPITFIPNWDAILSIGISGLIGFLFMGVRNPKYRFFLGYGWLILYQFALGTTQMDVFGIYSNFGGVFGAIFGYGSIAIIATAMGDHLFFSDIVENRKYQTLLIFGILNYIIPYIFLIEIDSVELQLLIDGFAGSAYLVNIMFVMTVLGLSSLLLWGFREINTRFKKKATWLRIFGMSPFLIYFLAEVPDSIFETVMTKIYDPLGTIGLDSIPWLISMIWGILILSSGIVTAWFLYKKNKQVDTAKVILIFLAGVIGSLLIFVIFDLTNILDLFVTI